MTLADANLGVAIAGGAAIGSFMTVVAARIPPLLLSQTDGRVSLKFVLSTLSWPSSHCTTCNTPLRWHDNIPLLSFLLLRGRCRSCRAPFSASYLLLELGGGLAGMISVHLFGWSAQSLLCFLMLSLLMVLSAIDLAEMLLPDILVLPLFPAGLAWQSLSGGSLFNGLSGTAAAFGVMWAIAASYRLGRKQDGLGGGDIKLAATLGAWLGLSNIPFFLMGAFASGLLVMSLWLALHKRSAQHPLPFGPFLALSAAVCVLAPRVGSIFAALIIP